MASKKPLCLYDTDKIKELQSGDTIDGTAVDIATIIHAATDKVTPVDADEIPLVDSAASFTLKKLTWANLKATAETYFDPLYAKIAQVHYVGTTSIAANRASAVQGLTGITSLTPGANFTLVQNSINVLTSEETGAVVNTLCLKTGNVGIGTSTPSSPLSIKGTAASDLTTYGAEFLTDSGWISTDWTGSWSGGWTHTVGNTSVLSFPTAAANATKYQISYTVTGRTAGTFNLSFGGHSQIALFATGAFGPTTTSTANLTITPTSTFDGTIVISIKVISSASMPIQTFYTSDGIARLEIRANLGANNTFIGLNAGQYNTTGVGNNVIGYNALYSNTTGNYNAGIGYQSLYSNIIGNYNTANGSRALYSNTTGYGNAANGYQVLYSNIIGNYNTANGYNALYSNTTGNYNTASGTQALYSNTTGYGNAANGYQAGYNAGVALQTNSNSVYLGKEANASANGLSNAIAIGYQSQVTASNQIVLGNTSITQTLLRGNVGIGTTATSYNLSFSGNSAQTIGLERHTTANTAGSDLTITAGGATSAATNKNGGQLILRGADSTGTGEAGVTIQGRVAGSSGTADCSVQDMMKVLGNKLGFYNVTPVVRPTALTAQLTTITSTAPSTPDYAIQDLTMVTPWGFASQDEGNTVLAVIANLQTRVAELETKLQSIGLLT